MRGRGGEVTGGDGSSSACDARACRGLLLCAHDTRFHSPVFNALENDELRVILRGRVGLGIRARVLAAAATGRGRRSERGAPSVLGAHF